MAKKTVKAPKLKALLSEVWYYVSEAFMFTIVLLLGVIGIVAAFIAAVAMAAYPMFFWSPWWGLLSIPLTLTLVMSLLLWRFDR